MLKFKITNTSILVMLFILMASCSGQSVANPLKSSTEKSNVAPSKPSTVKEAAIGTIVSKMSNALMIIFQDSQNNYWFGSKSEGVYKYDGESITKFTMKDGLLNNGIRGIQEDKSGHIYFDTGNGISKFDGFKIETLQENSVSKKEWKLGPDDLWFEGRWKVNGPSRFDGAKLYPLQYPKHPLEDELPSIHQNESFSPYDLYKTYKDSKGNIWMGTAVLGAYRFDGQSFGWISEREMTEIDDGPAPGVRSILEDQDGNFWFSSNMNHKYKVYEDDTAIKNGELNYEKLKGIDTSNSPGMNNFFMSITQDNNGDIWMASYDADVWRYDGQSITHYPIKNGDYEVLIFSIYKDNQGVLWLGTFNAGALRFNGESFEPFNPK